MLQWNSIYIFNSQGRQRSRNVPVLRVRGLQAAGSGAFRKYGPNMKMEPQRCMYVVIILVRRDSRRCIIITQHPQFVIIAQNRYCITVAKHGSSLLRLLARCRFMQ